MCGLVGAVSHRDVVPSLLEGLRRLEYRGYDSAGVAALNGRGLVSEKAVGRVDMLVQRLSQHHLSGTIGIGHTRWATHGKPDEGNAHPQLSGNEIAVVHNGIIENYEALRTDLEKLGYSFESDTDTEVIAHLIHSYCRSGFSLRDSVLSATQRLEGTFAIAAISIRHH